MMPAVRLQLASTRKKASKVPFCDNRQTRLQTVLNGRNSAGSALSDVMHREIMQHFKKAPIVAPLAASP